MRIDQTRYGCFADHNIELDVIDDQDNRTTLCLSVDKHEVALELQRAIADLEIDLFSDGVPRLT